MISSTKGTILNYFGLSNTYNPFKDEIEAESLPITVNIE